MTHLDMFGVCLMFLSCNLIAVCACLLKLSIVLFKLLDQTWRLKILDFVLVLVEGSGLCWHFPSLPDPSVLRWPLPIGNVVRVLCTNRCIDFAMQ